jgi:GAF domain-containing protein
VDSVIDAGYADDILPLEEIATALKLRILGPRLLERAEIKLELTPVLDAALAVQRTRLGNIQLLDRVTDTLHIVAQYGFRADFLEHFQVMSVDDDSLDSARAIRAQHRVVIEDVELDPLYAPHRKIASAAGYRAVQSTPFFARGRHLLGVLSTHSARPLALTPAQARNLDEFAAVAGDVVAGHL